MSNDLTIPFEGPMASAFAALAGGEPESLADGIGSSYPIIGYRGKVWTLRHRGETHTFVRSDDGSPANFIDVIILRQARHKSKSYYKDFDQNTSTGQRPICSSLDSVVPDADAQEKQSATCAVCARNIWKTDANGRKSRECTDYKRLAVFVLPKQTAAFNGGVAITDAAFLRVPPASLNDLAQFGETMSQRGYHYAAFVTRISFDPQMAHPQMVFRPIQRLTDAEAPTILKMREEATAKRITGEDAGSVTATVTPIAQVQHQTTQPVAQQPTQNPAPQTVTVAPAPASKPVAQPVVLDMTQASPGGAFEVAPPPAEPAPAPATQTAADTGAPSESDAALDARIASLLTTSLGGLGNGAAK